MWRRSRPLLLAGTSATTASDLWHLSGLVEDSSVRAVDRQKIKGYMLKWRDAKMLLGCAYFHDLLKPASILCKELAPGR